MAKRIPVLGIEADCLRAVRLTENGKDFVCDVSEEWSLMPEEGEPQAEDGADGVQNPDDVSATEAAVDEYSLVGAFSAAVKRFKTREFALALPLSRFLAKGVRVPEDISVVGYDNYTVSSICIPTITTIEVDLEKMASEAVKIMAKKLSDPSYTAGRRIISGRLIIKNSVLDISENSYWRVRS